MSQTYRMVYIQGGKLDHVSEILMSEPEAWSQLGTSYGLHVVTGWDVERCVCGLGFVAEKNGIRRSEHIEPVPSEIEDIALAVGLLQPASHRNGLEVVA